MTRNLTWRSWLPRSLGLMLVSCSSSGVWALDPAGIVTRSITVEGAAPATYTIGISADNEAVVLDRARRRPPTAAERQADLRDPVSWKNGQVRVRWEAKTLVLKRPYVERVQKAFAKFRGWAEVAAREKIRDTSKVVEDINERPGRVTGFRLKLVFVAPTGTLPAMLKAQWGAPDWRWEGLTTEDVQQFETLLKQLSAMEAELKERQAKSGERRAKQAAEQQRIDVLLK